MQILVTSFSLLNFLFHNWLVLQSRGINFFQNFFKKIIKNSKIFFLIFFFIIKKNSTFDVIFFSLIFSKNFIQKEVQFFFKNKKKIFQEIFMDFFLCSPKKLNLQIELILHYIFDNHYIQEKEISYYYNLTGKKLKNKINLENKFEFSLNIMKILKIFISNFNRNQVKIFNFFSFIFFKILSGIKIECLTKNFENFFDYLVNFLRTFREKKYNLTKKTYFQSLVNINVFLSFRYSNPLKILRIGQLKIQEKIFRFIIEIWDEYEAESSLLIPIFLNFGFFSANSKKISKSKNLFIFLLLVLNSVQSASLWNLKDFPEILTMSFVFLNFLESQVIFSQNYFFKLFSFQQKLNYNFKKSLCIDIFNSLSLIRKNKIYEKISNIMSFSSRKRENFDLNLLYLIFLLKRCNASCFSGNYITFWLKDHPKIFMKIFQTLKKAKKWNNFFNLLDFLNFFRYQIPIRLIFKILKKIFFIHNTDLKANSHLLNFIEKLFCLRGNDGTGLIMIDIHEKNLFIIEKFLIKNMKQKITLFKRHEILFKVILRFSLNFGIFLGYSDLEDKEDINFYLETYFFKNKNKITYLYIAETILMAICKKKKEILKEKFLTLVEYIFLPEFYEFLPFYFEFFSIINILEYKQIFLKILNHLISILENRLFWFSKYFLVSLIGFLLSALKKFNKIIDSEELASFLAIFEIYFKKFGFDENLLPFVIQLLNYSDSEKNFIPRLAEFLYKEKKFNYPEFHLINIIMFNRFIKKISFDSCYYEAQKLGDNFLFFSITTFYFSKVSVKNNLDYLIPFYFSEKFLESTIFFSNFIGRCFRKLIIELKNQKRAEKFTNKNIFRSSILKNKKKIKIERNKNFEKIYKIMLSYCQGKSNIINFYKFRFYI